MVPRFMGRSCKRSTAVGWLGAWPSELGSWGWGAGGSRQGGREGGVVLMSGCIHPLPVPGIEDRML